MDRKWKKKGNGENAKRICGEKGGNDNGIVEKNKLEKSTTIDSLVCTHTAERKKSLRAARQQLNRNITDPNRGRK
jgi:hypothetical protein